MSDIDLLKRAKQSHELLMLAVTALLDSPPTADDRAGIQQTLDIAKPVQQELDAAVAASDARRAKIRKELKDCLAMFKVGDDVTWTHYETKGNMMRMQQRGGKITSIGRCCMAQIKTKNGREVTASLTQLDKKGEATTLTLCAPSL